MTHLTNNQSQSHNVRLAEKRSWIWIALILAFVFTAYIPALDNYLLRDDFEWLNESYDGWRNPAAFFKPINNFFRPIVKFSYLLNYTLFGIQPIYYNLTTLLFHLINIWLIWVLMRRLSGKYWVASATALFFGISSHYSEVTLWAAARLDSVLLIFMLLTLLFLQKHYSPPARLGQSPASPPPSPFSIRQILPLTLLGVAALASKETGIILPLLAAGFVFFVLRRNWKQTLLYVWPLISLVFFYGLYFLVRPIVSGKASPVQYASFSAEAALWKAGNMFYTFIGLGSYFTGALWQYIVAAVLLLLLFVRLHRTGNHIAIFGMFWFLTCMAVSLPIFHGPSRYNYLPLLGFWIMSIQFISVEWARLKERINLPKKAILTASLLFTALYLAGQVVWLQWEIADYRFQGAPHGQLVSLYQTVGAALPRDRAFVFVNAGRKASIEEAVRNTKGRRKLLFMRADALWQIVYLPPLANFSGDPFRERLIPVPDGELPQLMKQTFPVLAFTDEGFFLAPREEEKLKDFYRREGKLPFRVQAVRFVRPNQTDQAATPSPQDSNHEPKK